MTVGEKLKNARNEAEFTQEQLAEKLGVSRQTISSWENERSYPDIGNLIELSDLYDLSLDELLKKEEKYIEDLQEKTDVVESNKQVMLTCIIWFLLYGGVFGLRTLGIVQPIENIWINMIGMLFVIGVFIRWIIKTFGKKSILHGSTSNKVLPKIGMGIVFIIAIFILFPLIDLITDNETVILFIRIIVILILVSPIIFFDSIFK